MIDINKQIAYWRDGAKEDWEIAQDLIKQAKVRYGLFFVHLALEKALKAHVCRHTNDLAPRIHSLVRLAEIAELQLSEEQWQLLAQVNTFNIEGRYPDLLAPPPTVEEARTYLARGVEVFAWLMKQL